MQDWQKVKDIFASVLEQDKTDRERFLQQSCGGDDGLLSELKSLLAAHDEPENLIEKNSIDLASKIASDDYNASGKHFGNYRIIREIGRGGMGTVFLAERDDGEFTKQVALKIVRQSIADAEIIARFKRERQILASLNHPNIAALYDGGVGETGEPFLAMEYVEGEALIAYATQNHLSIRERLYLFIKVCSAVSYAHRNLVVHRDIKPSNIIVTDNGEPKLLDFGLAKVFEGDMSVTQTAVRAFTPAYASPEQMAGDAVSTASDQYSLGVVLFELLSGNKPFDFEGKSLDEMIHTIRTSEPPSPSSLARRDNDSARPGNVPRDTDNITLKSMRIEPERRYGSVEALAEDIERHLQGLPVLARPNTLGYIASRFVWRNKTAVAAAVFVVIAVLGGLAVSIWQAAVARQERDRAERRFGEVRQLSNSLLFEIAPLIERLEGSIEARQILVSRALQYLDNLADESRIDAGLLSELALAYQKVGDLQGNPKRPNLSDFPGAIRSYEKSTEILDSLPHTVENRKNLASAHSALAQIRHARSEFNEALANSDASLAIYGQLAAENPDSQEIGVLFVQAQIGRARIFAINNQYEIAIPGFRKCLIDLARMDATDAEVIRLRASATAFLSNALSWHGSQDEAETENGKAVALAVELLDKYPNDSRAQSAVFDVFTQASSTFETIKNDVSLNFADKALQVARRSAAADAADTQARHNLAKALSRYGVVLTLVHRTAEGFRHLYEAERMFQHLIEREPRNRVYQDDFGSLYTRLGDAERQRSRSIPALVAYKRSAEIFGELAADDEKNLLAQRDWAQAVKSVAVHQIKLGRKDDAVQSLRLAIDIVKRLKERDAIGKWDEKFFSEMQPMLDKLQG